MAGQQIIRGHHYQVAEVGQASVHPSHAGHGSVVRIYNSDGVHVKTITQARRHWRTIKKAEAKGLIRLHARSI